MGDAGKTCIVNFIYVQSNIRKQAGTKSYEKYIQEYIDFPLKDSKPVPNFSKNK